MSSALHAVRSFTSMLLVGVYFALGSVVLRLVVIPASWLWPGLRYPLTSRYFKIMAAGILALLSLGGARFRRRGTLPTATPVFIVANHQSLVDILQVALMARPRTPAYVTRTRYARWVPLVSATLRLLRCPLVDPRRDPERARTAIQRGARELPHGLLIFPEGHRTSDGQVRPFRPRGLEAMLSTRRVPVYLVVSDGGWRVARFTDLLWRVHLIDHTSEVLGPYEIPENPDEIPAFIRSLRETIVTRLAERRGEVAALTPCAPFPRDSGGPTGGSDPEEESEDLPPKGA
jgi:1-acyl-sn-glycerol-3-phosphate acyltransferase